jgi:hypothetical protein
MSRKDRKARKGRHGGRHEQNRGGNGKKSGPPVAKPG